MANKKQETKKQKVVMSNPWAIGQTYLIRTVTLYYTGKLVDVFEHEIVLEDAAWVADTGRFAAALEKGTLNEVEPFPVGRVIVGRGAIIDASVWMHDLPRTVK